MLISAFGGDSCRGIALTPSPSLIYLPVHVHYLYWLSYVLGGCHRHTLSVLAVVCIGSVLAVIYWLLYALLAEVVRPSGYYV